MKRCLICGHIADSELNVCPLCGEATWADHDAAPPNREPAEPKPSKPKRTPKRSAKTSRKGED